MNAWNKQMIDSGWAMKIIPDHEAKNKCFTCCQDLDSSIPSYPAVIPGCAELDLARANVLPDPYYGLNVLELQKLEAYHFFYYTRFEYHAIPNHLLTLVFEGLDTICDLYVNGAFIGKTDNMLIAHSFPLALTGHGTAELFIHIYPACIAARDKELSPGHYSHSLNNYESLCLRKAPHMFGWDIAPRIVSAGIWKPVYLTWKPMDRIDDCYLMTHEQNGEGNHAAIFAFFKISVTESLLDAYTLRFQGKCLNSTFSAEYQMRFTSGQVTLEVDHAKLWWPKGRGEQNIYDVTIELIKNGKVADTMTRKLGIRKVRLERTSITNYKHNGKFAFYVNDERIFWLGSNWVPLDAFHCNDINRVEKAVALLDDIGCNSLRCWGGNVYESELFYDLCDRKGIMIWQDFSLACGVYPQDQQTKENLRHEAAAVVKRLRNHPSVVLWAGDNECDLMMSRAIADRDPNLCEITRSLFKEVLDFEDPTRPYLPSSPFYDKACYQAGREFATENHLWGPRDYFKSNFYTGSLCHFASEIGYHGCPSPISLKKFLTPDGLWPWKDNPQWIVHAANDSASPDAIYAYRIKLMADQIQELFGDIPDDLNEFALASQISQAEALKFFIELFRQQTFRTGIIWWNIIDCWPQFSDAIVDYYFVKKLAYYYIKQSQQQFLLLLQEPKDWHLSLMAINDQKKEESFSYEVIDAETDQTLLSGQAVIAADSTLILDRLRYSRTQHKLFIIRWSSGGQTSINHYLSGNPPFQLNWYKNLMNKYGMWSSFESFV